MPWPLLLPLTGPFCLLSCSLCIEKKLGKSIQFLFLCYFRGHNNFLVKIWFLFRLQNVITVHIRQLIAKIKIPAVFIVSCRVRMVMEVVVAQRIVVGV
ncbi:hypothetical protein B0H14DRAFT_3031214 [Mycena olivaceomarginata]|nr:hypothetical protein B0H14DRAFT_3031214 [Mycena olivaceomarginata]